MKLIESKAELVLQQEGIEGVYKQIELCGRTCYKSEDKITEDSAKDFVERMIKANHTAMLEQGTVYLKIVGAYQDKEDRSIFPSGRAVSTAMYPWLNTPYCKINTVLNKEYPNTYDAYITTNLRYIWERELGDMQGIHNEFLMHMCEPTEFHEKRYTMKFITDRGVMAELTRHRVFSFSIESTRYCNYSKDKFGGEISYIMPSWFPETNTQQQEAFMQITKATEDYYMALLGKWDNRKPDARFKTGFKGNPLTPQQARQVLPNALKTEVCMTGFASDWRYFFDLRYYGKTGKPHPDMELLASKARSEFMKTGLWDDIMSYPSRF